MTPDDLKRMANSLHHAQQGADAELRALMRGAEMVLDWVASGGVGPTPNEQIAKALTDRAKAVLS